MYTYACPDARELGGYRIYKKARLDGRICTDYVNGWDGAEDYSVSLLSKDNDSKWIIIKMETKPG